MAEYTPKRYAGALAEWRKGLRRELTNGVKRILNPHATALRKATAETTLGRKLWGSAYWTGGPRKSVSTKKRFDKAIAKGASPIPLIVRTTKATWKNGAVSTLELGIVAAGMARLISTGGLAKKTYLPQLKRKVTTVKRSFKAYGTFPREWSKVSSGYAPKVDKIVTDYTRKAGL